MRRSRYLLQLAAIATIALALAGQAAQRGPVGAPATAHAQGGGDGPATSAAGISFSAPEALQVTVDAGDDYATDVLQDPWDMDAARDIGYEIGYSDISASNGIWTGNQSGVDQASGAASSAYIFPLFQGFSTPVAGQLSQELAFNKIGARDDLAINTAKYTRLSYKLSVSPRTASSTTFVYWTSAKPVTWPDGSNGFGLRDACQGATRFVPWEGWRVYDFDLTQANGDPGARFGSWQGAPLVRGLRIDPSTSVAAGTQVKIDWIRLSDPASAPTIAIPWSATEAAAGDRVAIYVADNPAGDDAAPIAHGLPVGAGQYNLPTSILPPGRHYFQLRLQDGSAENGCAATRGASAWVGPLTVAEQPIVIFAKPSMTSGPDYATDELGQPWDMAGGDDVVTPGPPYPQTLADVSFSDGVLSARAVLTPPNTASDSQLWLRVDPNRPINSSRYRYFTVRLKVDLPAGRDINWAIRNGWGGRVIWWNSGIQQDGSESKYGTYHEGWRTYSVDLARARPPLPLTNPAQADNILTPREQNSFPAQPGWSQLGSVRNLRFDPLETMQPAVGTGADRFSIDWVKLTANDEVRQGQAFPIEVGVNVSPSSLQAINFYYTTTRSEPTQRPAARAASAQASPQAGANRVLLPLVSLPLLNPVVGNPLTYRWDTSGVAPGTYYICSTASTGGSVATYCSETPVVVLP